MLRCGRKASVVSVTQRKVWRTQTRLLIRTAETAYFHTANERDFVAGFRNVERSRSSRKWFGISSAKSRDVGESEVRTKRGEGQRGPGCYDNEEVFSRKVKMRRGQSVGPPKTIKQAEMKH